MRVSDEGRFAVGRRQLDRAAKQIEEVCADAADTAELVEGLCAPLNRALKLSGMLLSATDPDTMVLSTACVIENLPASMCAPWMHNEFLEVDFNKFTELARAAAPPATLHRATQGNPQLSPRYERLNRPAGHGPELRTIFAQREACWGLTNLLREDGERDFDDDELTWLQRLRPMIAAGFRRCTAATGWTGNDDVIPGVITLDPDGSVVSMTEGATRLLADLWADPIAAGAHTRLPGEAYMIATLTRARASGRPTGLRPVTRVHGRSGRWLTLRGDYALTASGDLSGIVLVIEPSRPTEIMPLVVAAYGLTAREQEVLTELSSGRTAGEIATRLFISEHTVRDHTKSILAKTGTGSRGALMSLLYHHHAYPVSEVVHV